MENSFNMCNICNIPKKMVPAKPGQYDSFMGCPNYKNHPPKIPQAQRNQLPQPQNGGKANFSEADPIKILADEIVGLRNDLKKLSRYVVIKFETPEEKQIRLVNEPKNIKDMEF